MAFNALGPALEAIREEFVLAYVGAGMALAAVGLGYTVGSLVGGPISDRVGTRPSIIVAAAVAALGMLLAGLSPALPAFLAGLAIASVGWGATEVAVTALIARAGAAISVRDLNLAQLGFALGAIAAPAIVGGAFALGWGWRPPVVLSSLLAASVAVAFTGVPAPRGARRHTSLRAVVRAAAAPVLLLIGLASALVVVLETGLAGFFAPFLEHDFALGRAAAAASVTAFWAGGFFGAVGRRLAQRSLGPDDLADRRRGCDGACRPAGGGGIRDVDGHCRSGAGRSRKRRAHSLAPCARGAAPTRRRGGNARRGYRDLGSRWHRWVAGDRTRRRRLDAARRHVYRARGDGGDGASSGCDSGAHAARVGRGQSWEGALDQLPATTARRSIAPVTASIPKPVMRG